MTDDRASRRQSEVVMEKGDPVQRGMYIPMEALPRDIVSRYGNVRVLVVPKERSSSTSSCKENEDCFVKGEGSVFEDDSDWVLTDPKSRTTPVSPDFTYRQRNVFDHRNQPTDSDRLSQDRQDTTVLQAKSESTPKRNMPEVCPPPLRFDKSSDENGNQTPHKTPEKERQGSEIKRQLFSGIENEYRLLRNESYRGQLEDREDMYFERMRDPDKHLYFSYFDKRSPVIDHPRTFFDRDFSFHDRSLPSPSWTAPTPSSPFVEHHRCDCIERQQRHIDTTRIEIGKKRKFGEVSTLENSIPLSPRLKKTKCTCSMMETNFLQMAEAAYKNIRRKDTSPASFEQFRLEIVQTNNVLKESVGILSTIREMCEHRSCIRS